MTVPVPGGAVLASTAFGRRGLYIGPAAVFGLSLGLHARLRLEVVGDPHDAVLPADLQWWVDAVFVRHLGHRLYERLGICLRDDERVVDRQWAMTGRAIILCMTSTAMSESVRWNRDPQSEPKRWSIASCFRATASTSRAASGLTGLNQGRTPGRAASPASLFVTASMALRRVLGVEDGVDRHLTTRGRIPRSRRDLRPGQITPALA